MSRFDLLGALPSTSSPSKTKPKSSWQPLAVLLGGPVIGGALGGIFGRSVVAGLGGALVGGTVGIAGCITVDGYLDVPGQDGGPSSDGATKTPKPPGLTAAHQSSPDMTQSPDMTPVLDMTGPGCVASLSGVGSKDWAIKFTIQTTAKVQSTVLYQRATCDATEDFWDIEMNPDGTLTLYMNHVNKQPGDGYVTIKMERPINDGQPHTVEILREGSKVSCYIDKEIDSSAAPCPNLGQLSTLGIMRGNPCEAYGTVAPLSGKVTNVCLIIA